MQELAGAVGEAPQAMAQGRRSRSFTERFDPNAVEGKRVQWNIDAIKVAVVRLAILQMIDDLQRCAQRIVGRPGAAAFAGDVEHIAPNRHRRVGAVLDELLPIGVTQFGRVHAEGAKQVLRVSGRHPAFAQHRPQRDAFWLGVIGAEKTLFEPIEMHDLVLSAQLRMVGDIVGNAYELIERKNGPTMLWVNQPGRDGKIFVPRSLSGSKLMRVFHYECDAY